MNSDYFKYRGKCKELSEELCKNDSSLILCKGYYHCPIWGKQEHWWCKTVDNEIIDPSVKQFPTKGIFAEYEEVNDNSMLECQDCGKELSSNDSSYYCTKCYAEMVGINVI